MFSQRVEIGSMSLAAFLSKIRYLMFFTLRRSTKDFIQKEAIDGKLYFHLDSYSRQETRQPCKLEDRHHLAWVSSAH